MNGIRLIALDMDGTLLNNANEITTENKEAIQEAAERGIEVVISTGRPFVGVHVEELVPLGVHYAITANGGAVYQMAGQECIFESSMACGKICPIIRELQKKEIHFNAFVNGKRYGETSRLPIIDRLVMPEATKKFIRSTTIAVDDMAAFLEENGLNVEKMTLNFLEQPDGSFKDRDDVIRLFGRNPYVTYLSGGYSNLELTKAGTTKGLGLKFLADYLHIPLEETMAVGDTPNDLDIIRTARVGVAMEHAYEEVKQAADFVTRSNEESGVAHAIRTLAFGSCR